MGVSRHDFSSYEGSLLTRSCDTNVAPVFWRRSRSLQISNCREALQGDSLRHKISPAQNRGSRLESFYAKITKLSGRNQLTQREISRISKIVTAASGIGESVPGSDRMSFYRRSLLKCTY